MPHRGTERCPPALPAGQRFCRPESTEIPVLGESIRPINQHSLSTSAKDSRPVERVSPRRTCVRSSRCNPTRAECQSQGLRFHRSDSKFLQDVSVWRRWHRSIQSAVPSKDLVSSLPVPGQTLRNTVCDPLSAKHRLRDSERPSSDRSPAGRLSTATTPCLAMWQIATSIRLRQHNIGTTPVRAAQ